MARWTRLISTGAALMLAVGLTSCTSEAEAAPTSTAPVVQLGGPGEPNRTLSPEEAAAIQGPPYVEEDVVFVRDMLHHHSQAIIMTDLVAERSDDEEVRMLAQRMAIGQEEEMRQMESWLQDRGEPARDPDAGHDAHAGMPGLLTEAELDALATAEGKAFDRMFLELMIKHHEGAVTMVVDLYASGGGQEVAIDTIARHVEGDQNIEIKRMQGMLADRS
ncbi:DUF305 domain-containing protein [Microbacterium sp. NPDC055910]|uniref:DUF305 domain-containing protein n=1 Tax=Microbacterium sp. NPDC055910 TaxID=3345659 RepID=UPI0035E23BA7